MQMISPLQAGGVTSGSAWGSMSGWDTYGHPPGGMTSGGSGPGGGVGGGTIGAGHPIQSVEDAS